jgi:hypothetical protein
MLLFAMSLAAQVDLRPPNLARCTPAVAQPVSVRQLASRPKRYHGRCVTVSGPTYLYRMYDGVPGIYLSIKRRSGGYVPARNLRHRLGLYFGSGDGEDGRPGLPGELLEAYHPTTVTGVADSCGRMAQALPRGVVQEVDPETGHPTVTITMLGGYCHYSGGAVVWVTQGTVDTTYRYERLVGEGARARYGTLVPAPRDWRHYRRLRELAHRFGRAVAAGNRAALSDLYGKFGASSDALRFLLEDTASPFVELRGAKRQLRFVILAEEWDQEGIPAAVRQTQDAVICFCRTTDCSSLWPIAEIDVGPDPDHPYACVEVSEDATGAVFLDELSYRGLRAPLRERLGR